ncbi:MAG: hypothetical protein F2840_15285 [Actinobacteria bacterium]|nr:hypothetical protein [Actinomycetota bacterium]
MVTSPSLNLRPSSWPVFCDHTRPFAWTIRVALARDLIDEHDAAEVLKPFEPVST